MGRHSDVYSKQLVGSCVPRVTPKPPRPIDAAMLRERPEKARIRQLWLETCSRRELGWAPGAEPLYLTLPGAEGRDIEMLAAAGQLARTETGAIAIEDVDKVVAFESNKSAYAQVRAKFPGLRVYGERVQDAVHGPTRMRYPTAERLKATRARVVNLDYTTPLAPSDARDMLSFPDLDVITKLAVIHASGSPVEWSLCLTLNATISWPSQIEKLVLDNLRENLGRSETFSGQCLRLLGGDLHSRLKYTDDNILHEAGAAAQRLLMILVPKRIAAAAASVGWRTVPVVNARYGGAADAAAMCTWIVDFVWDTRGGSQPNAVYVESLESSLLTASLIDSTGVLRPDEAEHGSLRSSKDRGEA